MKKVALIIKLLLIPFIVFGQTIKTDSVNYRATVVSEYINSLMLGGDESNVLFEMRGNVIFTSMEGDQRKSFCIKEWGDTLLTETGHMVKMAKAEDIGGHRLVITLGYDEKSSMNFIVLSYNNRTFFYELNEEQIPNKEEELYFYSIEEPSYTDEEVDEFLSRYGNPERMKTFMQYSLIIFDY